MSGMKTGAGEEDSIPATLPTGASTTVQANVMRSPPSDLPVSRTSPTGRRSRTRLLPWLPLPSIVTGTETLAERSGPASATGRRDAGGTAITGRARSWAISPRRTAARPDGAETRTLPGRAAATANSVLTCQRPRNLALVRIPPGRIGIAAEDYQNPVHPRGR